jgi:phage terminase large subunit
VTADLADLLDDEPVAEAPPESRLVIPTAEVFEPLLTSDARYLGAHGGRGSGKSQFFASLAVDRSIAAPTDVVCLRQVQRSLKFSVKREIENAIERYNAGFYFEVQDRQILSRPVTGGKGVMIFEGLQDHTADSIKSLSDFDVALLDEAQAIKSHAWRILRPTLRKPGSQIWAGWNPQDPEDPVDAFFRGPVRHPRAVVVEANYSENPWFPAELEEERQHDERSLSPEAYAWIWGGAYLQLGEALVFRNWKVEEFDTPPGVTHRLGADWGFSIDPSTAVRCHIRPDQPRRLFVDQEVWQVGCEIDRLPDLFRGIDDAERWPCVADSSRPETIAYMRSHGFPKMRAAIKGPGSVEDGVQWLQSFEIVVHPRCVRTAQELRTYAYKVDKDSGKPLPILSDKNNHVIDALRYACEDVRRAQRANERETGGADVQPMRANNPMARHNAR